MTVWRSHKDGLPAFMQTHDWKGCASNAWGKLPVERMVIFPAISP